MIEVEKRFKVDEEKISNLLKDFKFLGEITIHDVYYDYPDYRMDKKDTWLRNRNGKWELKIEKPDGSRDEIEDIKEIEIFLGTNSIEEFIKNNLVVFIDFEMKRREYANQDIKIDLDETNYGYTVGEIEVMVQNENEVEAATQKIIKFAEEHELDIKNVPTKKKEYFRIVKPEVYNERYGQKR